jgi:hypothetical protein
MVRTRTRYVRASRDQHNALYEFKCCSTILESAIEVKIISGAVIALIPNVPATDFLLVALYPGY